MKNEMQVFNNGEFGEIRTNIINGEPYLMLKDLCRALDIKNARDAKSRLAKKGVGTGYILTKGGKQQATFINESNLYKLIFQSRKPQAEKFTEWVTGEVLPAIRKSGMYGTVDMKMVSEIASAVATQVATTVAKEILSELKKSNDCHQKYKAIVNKSSLLFGRSSQPLKVESFEPEFREELDDLFLQMKEVENVNFSAISRYCYSNGHPVSNVSLARYFRKHFE